MSMEIILSPTAPSLPVPGRGHEITLDEVERVGI